MKQIGRQYWIKRVGQQLSLGDTVTCKVVAILRPSFMKLDMKREVKATVVDTSDNGSFLVEPFAPLTTPSDNIDIVLV